MKKLITVILFIIGFSANAQDIILADAINDGKLCDLETDEILSDTINAYLVIDFKNLFVKLTFKGQEETFQIKENYLVKDGEKELFYYLNCNNDIHGLTIVYDDTDEPIGIIFTPEKKYVLYVFPIKK